MFCILDLVLGTKVEIFIEFVQFFSQVLAMGDTDRRVHSEGLEKSKISIDHSA